MKKLLLFLGIAFSISSYATVVDTVNQSSEINKVTVFFTGAQVNRTSEISLGTGKHIIVLSELPVELNPKSIQVQGIDNCQILSVKHDIKQQQKKKDDPEILALEDQIDDLEERVLEITSELNVYFFEEGLLMENRNLGTSTEGSSIAEIKEAATYYRERLMEISGKKLALRKELDEIKETFVEIYAEMNEIYSQTNKTFSQVTVSINCDASIKSDLDFSYYIPSAGWEPQYDFRVEDISKPLSIVYNADVYQSSGEDWNNVDITLSTSNPSLTGAAPELRAWYLGYNTNTYDRVENSATGNGILRGTVYDTEMGEPVPYATVTVMQNNEIVNGSITDFDGNYMIKPISPGYYDVKCSYIGYQDVNYTALNISANLSTYQDFQLNSSTELLSEVVVTSYESDFSSSFTLTSQDIQKMPGRYAASVTTTTGGSYYDDGEVGSIRGARSGDYYYVDGIKSNDYKTTNYISNTVKNTVANIEYEIDVPYSIPSDGNNYSLKIMEVEVSVEYIYHAVPKIEEDAFLSAQLTDWTKLNLLSGKSSIYYNGTFTGESFIDVSTASDTLDLSLGRDKSIIIKREGNKEMRDKRVIGNNIKETIGWDITIKNNKNSKIKIVIEDQFPISQRKSVEVERLSWSEGVIDEQTGIVKWEITLDPKESKELSTNYSIKYSKYDSIAVE